MSLDGAQLNYVNADGIPVSYAAKGRKFNVGSLLGCDLVLPNAERLHCDIQCDAFGRVTICNHSINEPILLNDQIVEPTAKRPLLHGARIKILNELYTWHFPHVDATKTPSRPPPEQAANSSPSLKGHKQRGQFGNRLTVHNFRYSINSDDEGNTSIESRQLKTSSSSNEAESTDVDQLERSMTPVPTEVDDTMLKVDLVEGTQNKENTSTPSNKLLIELCARSDVVITSFSPRETGVKIEKSFTCVKRPSTGLGLLSAATTPMSINNTPKILFSEHKDDSYSRRAMDYSTPSTSTKSLAGKRPTSMYLIDLTTPQRLRPKLSGTPKQTLSSGSVISVNSTGQSSDDSPMVIDITNSSTPSTSTPPKKHHQSCLSAKTQNQKNLESSDTPKRTQQSLIKRALITSAKKQLSTEANSNQTTPVRKSLLEARRQCLTAPRRLPFHPQPRWRTPARRQLTAKPEKVPLTTPRRHPSSVCLNSPHDTKIAQMRKSPASVAKMSSGVEMSNKPIGKARRALNLQEQNSSQHISSPKTDRLQDVGDEPDLNEGSEAELSRTSTIDDEVNEDPTSEAAIKSNDGDEKPFIDSMNIIQEVDTSQSGQAAVNIYNEGSKEVEVNSIQEVTEKRNLDTTFDADQDQELNESQLQVVQQTTTEKEVANAEVDENAPEIIYDSDIFVTKEEIIEMDTELPELASHRDGVTHEGAPELNIVTVEEVKIPDPKESVLELDAVEDITEKSKSPEAATELAKDLSSIEMTEKTLENEGIPSELAKDLDLVEATDDIEKPALPKAVSELAPVEPIEEMTEHQETTTELPIDSAPEEHAEDRGEKAEPPEPASELTHDLGTVEVIRETPEPQDPVSGLTKDSDLAEITEDIIEKPEPLETSSESTKGLHLVEVIGETPELQETFKDSEPADDIAEVTENLDTPKKAPELTKDLDPAELQESASELSNKSDSVDAIKEITAKPENLETASELAKDLSVMEVIEETPEPQETALKSPKELEPVEALEDIIEKPEPPETAPELPNDSAPVEVIEDNICDEVPTSPEAARNEVIVHLPEDPICEEVPIKENIQVPASPPNGKESEDQLSQNITGTLMTPRRSTRRASMEASNKLEKQLSSSTRRASCSGSLENQGNNLTVATPKRKRRLTEELSTPTRKSVRLQNATPKRKALVDESVGDMGVIVEEEDSPQQDINKLPADEDYGSELPADETDELDRIDFHGMRELLKTPKNCSTPRFKGLREMMRTPKMLSSPILDNIAELLEGDSNNSTSTPKRRLPINCINLELTETETQDKYFNTPRGKNIMLPNEPASAVLKTRENSLATTTQYDFNGTNTTLHLDKIFDDMLVTDAKNPDEHSEFEINVTTVSAVNSTTTDPLAASRSAVPSLEPSNTVSSEALITVGDVEASNRDPLTSTAFKPGNNADMEEKQREQIVKSSHLCEVSGIHKLDQSSSSMFSEKLILTGIDSRDVTFEETKASVINVRTPRKSTLDDASDTDSMVGLGEPLVLIDDAEEGEVVTVAFESNAKSEVSQGSQPDKNNMEFITVTDRNIATIEDESINFDTSQTNSQETISTAKKTSNPELSIQKISLIEPTTNSDVTIDVTIEKSKSSIYTINDSEVGSLVNVESENSLCEDISKMSDSSKDVSVTKACNDSVENTVMTSHKNEEGELDISRQLETLGPEMNMPTNTIEVEVLNCEISSECHADLEDKSSIRDLNRSEADVSLEISVENKSIEKPTSSNDNFVTETNSANIQNVVTEPVVVDTTTEDQSIAEIQSVDLENMLLEKEYSKGQQLKEDLSTTLTTSATEQNTCENVENPSDNHLNQSALNTSTDDILPRSSEEFSADTNEKPSEDPALPELNAPIAGDKEDTQGDVKAKSNEAQIQLEISAVEEDDKLTDDVVIEGILSTEKPASSEDPALPELNAPIAGDKEDTQGDVEAKSNEAQIQLEISAVEEDDKLTDDVVIESILSTEKPASSEDPALPELNAPIAGDKEDTQGDVEAKSNEAQIQLEISAVEEDDNLTDYDVIEGILSTDKIVASHDQILIKDASVVKLNASLDDEVVNPAEAAAESSIIEGLSKAQSVQGDESTMVDIVESIIDLDASHLVEDNVEADQREVEEPTITASVKSEASENTTEAQIVQKEVRDVDESLIASEKSIDTENSSKAHVETQNMEIESLNELDEEQDVNKPPVFESVKDELSKEQNAQVKITSSEALPTDIIDINQPHIIDEADEVIASSDLRTASEESSVEERVQDEENIKGESKSNEVLKENIEELDSSNNVEIVNPLETDEKDQEALAEVVHVASTSLANEKDVNELDISSNSEENESMKASSDPLNGSTSGKSDTMESPDKSLSKDMPATETEADIQILPANATKTVGEEEQYKAKAEEANNDIESIGLPIDTKESSNNKDITDLDALEINKHVQQMETRKDKESMDTRGEKSLNSSEDEEKSDEAENQQESKMQPIEIDGVIELDDSTVESNIISDPCSSEVLSIEEAAVIELDDSTADSGSVAGPECEVFIKDDVVIELNDSSTESSSGLDKLTENTNEGALHIQTAQKQASIEALAESKVFDTRADAPEFLETVTTETEKEDITETPHKISDKERNVPHESEIELESAMPQIVEGVANQDKEQAQDIDKDKVTSRPIAKLEEPSSKRRSAASDATQGLETSEEQLDSQRTEDIINNQSEKMLSDTVILTESVDAEQDKTEALDSKSNEESELHKHQEALDSKSNEEKDINEAINSEPAVERLLEEQIAEDAHAEKLQSRPKSNRLARNLQINANETISKEAAENSENKAEEENKSAKPKQRGRKAKEKKIEETEHQQVEINAKDPIAEDPVLHTKDKSEGPDERLKPKRRARKEEKIPDTEIIEEREREEDKSEEPDEKLKPKREARKDAKTSDEEIIEERETEEKSAEPDEKLKPKRRARKDAKTSDEEIIEERETEEKSAEPDEKRKPKRRARKDAKTSDEEIIEGREREEEKKHDELTEQPKTKHRSGTTTENEAKEDTNLEADVVQQTTDVGKSRRKRVQRGTTEVESKGATETEKVSDERADLSKPTTRGRIPTTDVDKTVETTKETAKPRRRSLLASVEVVAADLVGSPTEDLVEEKPKRRGRKASVVESAGSVERKPTRSARKASAETVERQEPVHTSLTSIREVSEPLSKILHVEELAPQVTPITKGRGRRPSTFVEEGTPVISAKATETRKRRKALVTTEQPAESVVHKIKLLDRKESTDGVHSDHTDSAEKPTKLRRKGSSDVEHIATTEVPEITAAAAGGETNVQKKPQRRNRKPSAHLETTVEDLGLLPKKVNARRGRKASVVEKIASPKDLAVESDTIVKAILVNPLKLSSDDEMTPRRREGRNLPRKNYDETSDEEKRGSATGPRRNRKQAGSQSAKATSVATPPLPKLSTPQKHSIVESTTELTTSETPVPNAVLPEPTSSPRREGRNVPRKNYSETSDDDKPGTSRGRRVRQPTAKALELLVDMELKKRPATPKRRKAKDDEEQPQEKKLASDNPEPVVRKPRGGARRKAAKEDYETEAIIIEPQVTKRAGRVRKESATTQHEEPEQAVEQEPKLLAAKRNVRGASSSRKTKAVAPLDDASQEQPAAKKGRRGGSRTVTPVIVEQVEITVEEAPAAKKTTAGRGRGRQMQTVEKVDPVDETAAPTRGGRPRKVHFETAEEPIAVAVETLDEKEEAPKRATRSRRK